MICGDETAEEHQYDGWGEDLERRGKIRGGGGLRPTWPSGPLAACGQVT